MVGLLFDNVRLHASVEVLIDGVIVSGKVRWKGKIPDKQGCWVGLELWTRSEYPLQF